MNTTIIEKANYRLCRSCQIVSKEVNRLETKVLNVAQGLCVEKQVPNRDTYYVIFQIKFDKEDKISYIDVVANRILDIEPEEWSLVRDMLDIACKMVELSNKGDDYE